MPFRDPTSWCQDRAVLAQLYEDFLSSGENWMQSSIVCNATRKATQRRRGKFKLVEYKMLKQTYGQAIAKQLRDGKMELQASKDPSDGVVYWMEHPDLPGKEDRYCEFMLIGYELFSPQL